MAEIFKLSGAGNDFLALVEPARTPSSEEIRAWCTRGISLGADGLFLLERTPRGARMVHYNADGGRSDLCLNGSRCAAQLAFELGWARAELELETDAGALRARRVDASSVAIELPPFSGKPRRLEPEVEGRRFPGWLVCPGVPHFVLPWSESLARAPVAEIGPLLRRHPEVGSAGANVNFVRHLGECRFEIRTFERGVEAETLACGTGVVAATWTGIEAGTLSVPAVALTAGGFELTVDRRLEPGGDLVFELAGDARLVLRGGLLAGAGASLEPARWSD